MGVSSWSAEGTGGWEGISSFGAWMAGLSGSTLGNGSFSDGEGSSFGAGTEEPEEEKRVHVL